MNTVCRQTCEVMNSAPAPTLPVQTFVNAIKTMKTRPVPVGRLRSAVALVMTALAVSLYPARLHAQATPNPPERLTYQGFLVDGNGVALGNSAPKNYDVIFRIYNDQTAGAMLWAEQQTVTVDKGYFSVLLGEGASTGESRPLLSTLFRGTTASDRFVGITVKGIGSGGANVDILPRLRLLSSPYAFLAQNAVKLVQNNGADLISSSGNAVTIAGPVNATSVSASTLTGNGANITGIDANNITQGTIPNGRTTATSANVANTIVARDGAGGFSMGPLSAGAVQAAANVASHTQGAYLEWNKGGGDGVTYLLNQKGLGGGGIVFGDVSAANVVTEGMRLTTAGNLGLGISNPDLRLVINGSAGITGGNVIEFGRGVAGKEGNAGKIGYQTYTAGALDIVGAGTTLSNRKIKLWTEGGLDVNGGMSLAGGLDVNSYNGLTFKVQNNVFQVFHGTDKNRYFQMWRYDQGVAIWATGGNFGNSSDYSRQITWDGDGNWDSTSDRKLKKNIVDAEPMLDRALQVQVRRFQWKGTPDDSKYSLGVIAQELQPLFPDSVSTQENPVTKETNLAVGYSDFGLIAVKAIQEFKAVHDAEIADLKAQMAELIQINKELRSRLDKVAPSSDNGQ